MCQFCNLTRLSRRVSPLGAQPQSLSSWGQLSKSLTEIVLKPQPNPISKRLI
jgi:hypothetical protein